MVDLLDVDHLDVRDDAVLGAEIEHLLRFGDAADQRSGNRLAPENQHADVRRRVGMFGHADQAHRAVAPEQRGEGVEIMACRDRVEDEVEAAGMRRHLLGVARHDHLVGAEIERVLPLAVRGGEGDDVRAHRMGELHAHMAEAADPDDTDLLARAGLPVTQRRPGGDAGAEQRRDRGELFGRMGDAQHELVADDDALGIAAQRMAGRIRRRPVIGAGEAVLAKLLQPLGAGRTMLAAVDQAADADGVADLEAADRVADRAHRADDLMARHARVERPVPFRANLVQVGMAHAAIGDLDLHIVRTGRAAFDVERFEFLVRGKRAKGLGHGRGSLDEG